jgi:hypothetical protein
MDSYLPGSTSRLTSQLSQGLPLQSTRHRDEWSKRLFLLCQSYASLYVALSRVKKSTDICLLLNNNNWESIKYISSLQPDKCIKAFFAGYQWSLLRWSFNGALEQYDNELMNESIHINTCYIIAMHHLHIINHSNQHHSFSRFVVYCSNGNCFCNFQNIEHKFASYATRMMSPIAKQDWRRK